MIDNDLCGKCPADCPVRICCLNGFFHTTDICDTAVIKRCTKAYDKDFIISDIILIQRIILGSITGISAEIIRICIFTGNKCFLCICQLVPCFFCSSTLLIGFICSFLNINSINQFCYLICSCLIVFCRLCTLRIFYLIVVFAVFVSASGKHACSQYTCQKQCKCFLSHNSLLFEIQHRQL